MDNCTNPAKAGGSRLIVLGAVAVVLGMLAMLAPGLTGISIVMCLALLVLAGGIIRIFWAFQAESLGRGLLTLAIGGLTLLCGLVLLGHPLFASGVLAIVLAGYFILDGLCEIAAGIRLRPAAGSGWLLFGGVVSILLGIIIWAQFPLSGAWAMGILLGIKLFCVGLVMIAGGSALRSMAAS